MTYVIVSALPGLIHFYSLNTVLCITLNDDDERISGDGSRVSSVIGQLFNVSHGS